MDWFYWFHAIVSFFIGAMGVYQGVTGRIGRGPRLFRRAVGFLVAGVAVYFLIIGVQN